MDDANVDGADDRDSWVTFDYTLGNGSGSGDAHFAVPKSMFPADESQYVYLYTEFSGFSNGFEEWGLLAGLPADVPEPTTLSLVALGGLGLLMRKKRRGLARGATHRQ